MEVIFYEKPDGTKPAEEFILQLSNKMQARVFWTLDLLETAGWTLREPYSTNLGDGIFELRIQQANGIVRVLYFFHVGDKAILTNGFVKKTQKTPPAEIELAKKYRQDFLQRQDKQ